MSVTSTLIQATNLVLLISNSDADVRKFIVWQDDGEDLKEVLSGLEIVRIALEDNAKIFEHPLETGAVITDHIIYNPKNVAIQAYISNDDEETLLELETLYLSGASLKIQAGNKIIDKVVIAGKPNEITGTVFDKTLYSINFKEAQEVTPAYTAYTARKKSTKSASNAPRVNYGTKKADNRTEAAKFFDEGTSAVNSFIKKFKTST